MAKKPNGKKPKAKNMSVSVFDAAKKIKEGKKKQQEALDEIFPPNTPRK